MLLLKRMRNTSTPVFLYPPDPGVDLENAYRALATELSVQSYRILPDRQTNLVGQLSESSIAVFLLGASYDERAKHLIEVAAADDKPWVVWSSPSAETTRVADQAGFCAYVERFDSSSKTYLNAGISSTKLKEEVLSLLRPDSGPFPETPGKPRVYLVYNTRDLREIRNAGHISFHFREDCQFEHPDDPALHTRRLAGSDAVLLVWGTADENWCSREFAEMVQSSRRDSAKGLCVFDPRDTKLSALHDIREKFAQIHIAEQFGGFEAARLQTFFNAMRYRRIGGQP